MKAFLMAAGLGTRLRPLTEGIPKCLVPIDGKPLLQIWLELLGRHGISEALVNTHHLAPRVQAFAQHWKGPPRIRVAHESELLGSAGTLAENWRFVHGEESFLVAYADNLTDIDLGQLMRFHYSHSALVTMTVFPAERPRECGIVEMDRSGLITGFAEKPASPRSSLANGGVYVMRDQIASRLPWQRPADIGLHLLPECVGDMYGWLWDGLLLDIGNPPSYAKAQRIWRQRPSQPALRPSSPEGPLSGPDPLPGFAPNAGRQPGT